MHQRRLWVKRTKLNLLLTMSVLVVLMALSACVRPAPDSVDPSTLITPTPDLAIQPTFAPIATFDPASVYPGPDTLASPTPFTDQPPVEGEVAPPVEPAPEIVAPPEEQAPPPEQPVTSSGETIHIVQPGDNLFRIGLRYGFTAQELATYNNIPNVNIIYVGQEIRIPPR
jgi:LysM repeat protein